MSKAVRKRKTVEQAVRELELRMLSVEMRIEWAQEQRRSG